MGSTGRSPGIASVHRRPDPLLAAAIVLQWIVTAGVALFATHTGSLFGDRVAAEQVVANADSLAHGVCALALDSKST